MGRILYMEILKVVLLYVAKFIRTYVLATCVAICHM